MRAPGEQQEQEGLPIASVEQSTGIARATLRIWERRYGFPHPGRDLRGERSYPEEQVRKLRLIADLMARGHRPGRLVALNASQLAALSGPAAERSTGLKAVSDPVLDPLRSHDVPALSRLLEDSIRSQGLAGFVTERMPAMNDNVGLAWAHGDLEVYEEHLYSEVVQQVVRAHMARLPAPRMPGPRVLLATLPEELHGLGLLMTQALLAVEGRPCTSLGVRVPLAQIVSAAAAFRADIVGLSFSSHMNAGHVLRGLEQLRGELAPHVAVWAGGSAPVLARRRIAGVQRIAHVRDVPAAVAQWSAATASSA
jgi:MerR family transcriptional regulator, light-induced transcriptional regulator